MMKTIVRNRLSSMLTNLISLVYFQAFAVVCLFAAVSCEADASADAGVYYVVLQGLSNIRTRKEKDI